MIDGEDAEEAWLFVLLTNSPGLALVMIAFAVVATLAYVANADECARKSCPGGRAPKLMDHECLCPERAR